MMIRKMILISLMAVSTAFSGMIGTTSAGGLSKKSPPQEISTQAVEWTPYSTTEEELRVRSVRSEMDKGIHRATQRVGHKHEKRLVQRFRQSEINANMKLFMFRLVRKGLVAGRVMVEAFSIFLGVTKMASSVKWWRLFTGPPAPGTSSLASQNHP